MGGENFLGVKSSMKTDIEIRQEGGDRNRRDSKLCFPGMNEAEEPRMVLRVLCVIRTRCRGIAHDFKGQHRNKM